MPTNSEVRAFAHIDRGLRDQPYRMSVRARALDVLEEVSRRHLDVRGPCLGDVVLPALREQAGPFCAEHPWLQPGDWSFAMKAHFDFVVEAATGTRHPLHPIFAVEFDGPTHQERDTAARDRRKNRLCLAAGLPLLRVRDEDLAKRDRLTLVEWLVGAWATRQRRLPELIRDRDQEIAEMGNELVDELGPHLLLERPDLDVELIFGLENPFPPISSKADRLARSFGFEWSSVGAATPEGKTRWRVERFMPPMPALNDSLVETWNANARLVGPGGAVHDVQAALHIRNGYETRDDGTMGGWDSLVNGVCPYLPAGPWIGATSFVGEALCWYRLLVNVEECLRRS